MLETIPTRLRVALVIGLVARVVGGACSGGAFDFYRHRLPTARCLDEGRWLYCDCVCNHTPLYPYVSALMFRLSPAVAWIQALFIMLPAAIGDALVGLVLFFLLRSIGKASIAVAAASIYALNPISIYEIRLAHWDGLTVLFLLASLYALSVGKPRASGLVAGFGALLKQFPVVMLLIAALKERNVKTIVAMGAATGAVALAGFLPFLLECPETLVKSLAGHPLWQGEAPTRVGIGTVRDLFERLGVPHPTFVWLVVYVALLAVFALRTNGSNYFYFAGLVLVVVAYFTYATHRQLVVWALPFMISLSLERRARWALGLVGAGYAIRLLKPDWYFGLVHLAAGAWYYAAFAGALAKPRRRAAEQVALGVRLPARLDRSRP